MEKVENDVVEGKGREVERFGQFEGWRLEGGEMFEIGWDGSGMVVGEKQVEGDPISRPELETGQIEH